MTEEYWLQSIWEGVLRNPLGQRSASLSILEQLHKGLGVDLTFNDGEETQRIREVCTGGGFGDLKKCERFCPELILDSYCRRADYILICGLLFCRVEDVRAYKANHRDDAEP